MAGSAIAASSCSYDAQTKTLSFSSAGGLDGVPATVNADGTFSSSQGVCATATTQNTEAVVLNHGGAPASIIQEGPLVGGSAELDGGPEIEVALNGSGLFALVDNTNRATGTIVGRGPSGERQININAEIPSDNDADIVQAQRGGTLSITSGPLNDVLSTAGGRGTGAAWWDEFVLTLLDGGAGDDQLTGAGELRGGPGNDAINAIAPKATIAPVQATSALRMRPDRLGTQPGGDGNGGTDTYSGFTTTRLTIVGTRFSDAIYGSDVPDVIHSGEGDDVIVGNGGSDQLYAGVGGDQVGAGDNTPDSVYCSDGVDTALTRPDGADTLELCEFSPATMSIADGSGREGDPVLFTVSLSDPLQYDARATLTTSSGTADSEDTEPASITVTIPAGQTSTTVGVPTTEDQVVESDETIIATLSALSSAPAPGDLTATGTIADDDGTGTVISLTPSSPPDPSGFYTKAPMVVVAPETPARAAETRCVLDPAATPENFASLPTAPCPYLGTGAQVEADGAHTIYAATRTTGGDTGAVVARTFSVDRTPPTVTCSPLTGVIRVGDAPPNITATVSDSGSGAIVPSAAAPADTTSAGPKTVVLSGIDRAGHRTSATCAYVVEKTIPVVLCGGAKVVLLDVLPERGKVRLNGVVLDVLAGRPVSILAGGRIVGTTTAAPDGSFTALVPRPSARERSRVRYQAVVGENRSTALRLERLLVLTRRSGRTVVGRLTAPKRSRRGKITLYRQLTCTEERRFKTIKLRRNGTFRVTLDGPLPGEPYALYRVVAPLRRGTTYTLPIAVR